eukprot:3680878-Pyramimonas_sp.AAC.1
MCRGVAQPSSRHRGSPLAPCPRLFGLCPATAVALALGALWRHGQTVPGHPCPWDLSSNTWPPAPRSW